LLIGIASGFGGIERGVCPNAGRVVTRLTKQGSRDQLSGQRAAPLEETPMATVKLLTDEEASPEARAVFDDIRKTRSTDYVNNSWRALANDPVNLKASWEKAKQVMGPGTALDPLVKEFIYITVSIMNNCEYCIHTHTHFAKQKGMTQAQYNEMLRVIGLATEGNRMMTAMQVPPDERFKVK
jgi:AhpD family alkylhydroperoxidase